MRDPQQYTNIQQVARALNMSERTLRRRLAEVGTTFKEVAFRYRMTLACEYLVSTDLPIMAISIMVGYSDTANFFRAFHQYVDMTPGEYRTAYAEAYCELGEEEEQGWESPTGR